MAQNFPGVLGERNFRCLLTHRLAQMIWLLRETDQVTVVFRQTFIMSALKDHRARVAPAETGKFKALSYYCVDFTNRSFHDIIPFGLQSLKHVEAGKVLMFYVDNMHF